MDEPQCHTLGVYHLNFDIDRNFLKKLILVRKVLSINYKLLKFLVIFFDAMWQMLIKT